MHCHEHEQSSDSFQEHGACCLLCKADASMGAPCLHCGSDHVICGDADDDGQVRMEGFRDPEESSPDGKAAPEAPADLARIAAVRIYHSHILAQNHESFSESCPS